MPPAATWKAPIISRFTRANQAVQVELQDQVTERLPSDIRSGRVDFTLVVRLPVCRTGPEYVGVATRALEIEGRMTLSNLSIVFGSRVGLVSPGETTIDYVAGRHLGPREPAWTVRPYPGASVHYRCSSRVLGP